MIMNKKKTLKIALFIFALIVLSAIVGGYEFFRSRVPQMNGEAALSGLSAPVEVVRDRHGIPHINAQTSEDAFRTLGYVMASERLFQMEVSRRLAQGELAELLGEKLLRSDKLFRNLGLKYESEKLFARKTAEKSFDPQMLKEMNAFYDGVNQFVEKGALPIEFKILGIKPRPFSMVDGQSFVGLMGFSFGIAIMTEPLLTDLAKRIGGDLTNDLRNEKIPNEVTRVVDTSSFVSKEVLKVISSLESGFPLFEGSNGWLLSGKRTSSGSPVLSNDPHISYSHPGIWFEAHIKTPEYESYGHFLSLIPFPILSHNRERGWGLTMSLTDDMDIYQEQINEKDLTYRFKGKDLPLEKREEIIKVKNAPDFKMTVFKTHHGPILDYALSETTKEKSLSLQWPFYSEKNDPFTTVFRMGRAKNMQEFKDAVATGMAPGLNILYADKENIGWWIFGEVWKKRPGIKTDFILDGQSGNDEIIGALTMNEKPHLENPESGLIVSANARPAGYPAHLRGDWQPDDRQKTLEKILSQNDKWSPEELMEVQALNMNFENKVLLHALLNDLSFKNKTEENRYEKYVQILREWNLSSEITSIAPSIYYSWARDIQKKMLVDLTDDEKEIFAKVPNGWIFFKRVILEPTSPWWKKFDRAALLKETFIGTITTLEKRFGEDTNEWKWGKLHTLEFVHPIGRVKPLNYIFNLGPYPAPGATQEVNNQKVTSYKGDFAVTAGPSTRRIIDFARPEKAWGILPIGNSGHLLSPFYNDQVQLFLEGKYREELLDLDEGDARFKMTFKSL
ncbi:penicillin acylase family protein [Bacteriovorax stolpii]|uniref:penicillin acylase family protein n=1 Tax=Bacteriovorax stolpii TaxID=960 RepID=UPI001157F660|nr:penicillin acylase family protein [Bacteriovorax stolpii]QDK41444.1 penicillin acylase family protein [Bacteriovorax stolpii]